MPDVSGIAIRQFWSNQNGVKPLSALATTFARSRREVRAPAGDFLTEEQLRRSIPAIFAETPHESRSDRYRFIPTVDVLHGLSREGFRPVFAATALARDSGMQGYTKHMLRFRRADDLARVGEVPEIIGINSHGGQCSYQMLAGIFRFVCANGLVLGDKFQDIRAKHSGRMVDDVIEGTYRVVDTFAETLDNVAQMKALPLAEPEQLAFAEAAAILRTDPAEGEQPSISARAFNVPRRYEDRSNDLWTTFNRVQENTLRGGLHGRAIGSNGRSRRVTTREVQGIDQNVKLNRALWTLAERMREIKAAA